MSCVNVDIYKGQTSGCQQHKRQLLNAKLCVVVIYDIGSLGQVAYVHDVFSRQITTLLGKRMGRY